MTLIGSAVFVVISLPAQRGGGAEPAGGEPPVVGGQRAQHLRDGRGLGGLLHHLQAQRRHRRPDHGPHAGGEYVHDPTSIARAIEASESSLRR